MPIKKYSASIFNGLGKAVIWSFNIAKETSSKLLSIIVGCFILEAVIPVASTAALGALVAKLKDVTPGDSASFQSLSLLLGLTIGLIAFEFILAEIRSFSRIRLIDETGVNLQKQLYQQL